jgi:hypothetical protein
MAQSGYTPIQLYYSTTATNTPAAGDLANGELAINIPDGKLFYNDGGTVKLLASNAATTNVSSFQTSLSGLTPSTATTGVVTLAGTLGTSSGGTNLTSFTSGGALYATSTSALTTGTLPVASGGTGQSSVLTQYGVVYGSTTTGMATTAAGTSTQVLHGNASGAPTWSAVSLTADVSGTLPVASGGTGTSTAFTTGSVVFAGASGTYTQDNANFFWDDTNNYLGIGTAAPTTKLTLSANTALPSAGAVSGTTFWSVSADSTLGNILIDSFAAGSGIIGRRAQGTSAAPSAVNSTHNLMRVLGYGYGTSSYSSSSRVSMDFQPDETWTDTAQGTKIQFLTTTNGTTTTAERMRIHASGGVSIGTTTDPGAANLQVAGAIVSTRIDPRSLALASTSGAITPNSDLYDQVNYSLTGSSSFSNPSGTPVNGQKLSIRLYAASTQTISSWSSSSGGYRAIGATLPTSVVGTKTIYVGAIWNSTDSFWDVVAVATQT